MTHGDGDGWVGCGQDHQHWGRHGAAGLLIWAPDGSGRPLVLLIRRAGWSHHGDTWGPPGGARDSHETPAEAAVREAAEECGAPAGLVRISGLLDDDHGGWSYQTLIGQAAEPFAVAAQPGGHRDRLDPGRRRRLAPAAPGLRRGLAGHPRGPRAGHADRGRRERDGITGRRLVARPCGRDGPAPWRADGAGGRRHRPAPRMAAERPWTGGTRGSCWWWRASPGRCWTGCPPTGAVQVVAAPGEGDDTIADLAGRLPGRRFVVTADRELRRRCEAGGRGRHRAAVADGAAGGVSPAGVTGACPRSERRTGRLAK